MENISENDSVWLGRLRNPVKIAMMTFIGLAAVNFVWLVFGRMFLDSPIGVHEMVRPAGLITAQTMLFFLAMALLFSSIFLSDKKGIIEPDRDGFFDIFSLVCSRLAMMSIAIVVLVMFYEVVSRYIFNKPTLWANELSLWIAGFVFLLAGLYAMQQRSHIRIYIIYDMLPRWVQKSADVLSVVLIWVFFISMYWGAYNEAKTKILRMETFGTAWDPPLPSTIKLAILVIIGLVCIQALSNLIADWKKAPEHHSPADEIDETEIEIIRKTLE